MIQISRTKWLYGLLLWMILLVLSDLYFLHSPIHRIGSIRRIHFRIFDQPNTENSEPPRVSLAGLLKKARLSQISSAVSSAQSPPPPALSQNLPQTQISNKNENSPKVPRSKPLNEGDELERILTGKRVQSAAPTKARERRFYNRGDELKPKEIVKVNLLKPGFPKPIMLKEMLQVANFSRIKKQRLFICDATLGDAAHSKYLIYYLHAMQKSYRYLGIDWDYSRLKYSEDELKQFYNTRIEALNNSKALHYYKHKFHFCHNNFENLPTILEQSYPNEYQQKFDLIFLDLGPSYTQLSNSTRGFYHKILAPLDMRFHPGQRGLLPAHQLLRNLSLPQLIKVFKEYAPSEMKSLLYPVARGIKMNLHRLQNHTTTELNFLLRDIFKKNCTVLNKKLLKRDSYVHSLIWRVYEILRMEVNHEKQTLKKFFYHLPNLLVPGGKCIVMSCNPFQDEIVKKEMRKGILKGNEIYSYYTKDPIEPSEAEVQSNYYSKRCLMRFCIRAGQEEEGGAGS